MLAADDDNNAVGPKSCFVQWRRWLAFQWKHSEELDLLDLLVDGVCDMWCQCHALPVVLVSHIAWSFHSRVEETSWKPKGRASRELSHPNREKWIESVWLEDLMPGHQALQRCTQLELLDHYGYTINRTKWNIRRWVRCAYRKGVEGGTGADIPSTDSNIVDSPYIGSWFLCVKISFLFWRENLIVGYAIEYPRTWQLGVF